MHTFLFIFYALACGLAICRLPFIRNTGIRPVLLLSIFALHVFTGLAHNIISYRYYPEHGDIWDYFWNSFMFRYRLFHDFPRFLSDSATWTLFSHNGMIFIQMILSFLSNDHLDTNTLLFSFPVFLGNIALFRVFRHRFPNDPLTAFTVFLTPSVLFWTSCIHREGVLYMLLGFLLLGLHRMMTGGYAIGRLLRTSICFLLIVYFRIGFALTLLVPVFIWIYMEQRRLRPILSKTAMAAIGITLLAVLTFPGLHIPGFLANWQNEFYSLYGHSRLALPALDGSWASLFRTLPAAALNGFFEPLPGAGGQPIYLAFSIELLLIWTIDALALRRRKSPPPPFAVFCILFSLTGMLLIGIFVPFAGTIVRYRSIYLPFLLAPCLHSLATTRPLRALNHWFSHHIFYEL